MDTKTIVYPKNVREVQVYLATFRGKRLNIRVMNSHLDYVIQDSYAYSYQDSATVDFNVKKFRGRKWVSAGSMEHVWCIELVGE